MGVDFELYAKDLFGDLVDPSWHGNDWSTVSDDVMRQITQP